MKTRFTISLILVMALAACGKQTVNVTMVGADRDAHGCIGSAGYSWCEKTAQCEHPWELALKENVELSAHQFSQFCKN
jgi:hypothetical protein